MESPHQQTALRIAIVSLLLASLASTTAWFIARERAAHETVSIAVEASERLIRDFDASVLESDRALSEARKVAHTLLSGLFDIAEIYDKQGKLLAESRTEIGEALEPHLPEHDWPAYQTVAYESHELGDDEGWVMRVFIPLTGTQAVDGRKSVLGYLEGVRVISPWQQEQIKLNALAAALTAGLASVLCGLALYPVLIRLMNENRRKAQEVLGAHLSVMEALGHAIAKRDSETGAHNFRVACIATCIAEQLGTHGTVMQSLIVGSFLHDVGKIGVPDAILLKPGKLNDDELWIMRQHIQLGEEIIDRTALPKGAKEVVSGHHERWDGTGYPRGLKGEQIPLVARIFAVADVFDALCSKRPYKDPMDFEMAMQVMERETGHQFDPKVMAAFRPIAQDIYARLSGMEEESARSLLNERVRLHFALDKHLKAL